MTQKMEMRRRILSGITAAGKQGASQMIEMIVLVMSEAGTAIAETIV